MSDMYAWQFKTAAGGIEKNLFPASGVPKPHITDDQILVEVYSAALNPIDYKLPEIGLIARGAVPSPCIPGKDFCGKVYEVGSNVSSYRIGEMVFGTYVGPLGSGSLGQFIAVSKEELASVPTGLEADHMAGIGIAGLTAYQSIQPNVKSGDKVFINGGSGGTGIYGIQIAKALGCHVTTSCSSANIELCRSLGADEIIDYKSSDLVETLKKKGQAFDLVVDNVSLPSNLYSSCHHFVQPSGKFVQVGVESDMSFVIRLASNFVLPGFLGGGKRKYSVLILKAKHEDLSQFAEWLKEGKVKTVIDSAWEYDDVPKAFEKLKTHRAKGKIVVHMKKDISQ